MGFAKLLPLIFFAALTACSPARAAEPKEYLYRISAEDHDRNLKEAVSWVHLLGSPLQGEDLEDFLIRKSSWGRFKTLKEAGFTREAIY